MVSTAPERGDVVMLNFDPQTGTEIWGRRPALVLSPQRYNQKTSLALMVPITTRAKGNPFEVRIPMNLIDKVDGVILSDQIKSLDWEERQADTICQLPDNVINDVLAKLQTLVRRD